MAMETSSSLTARSSFRAKHQRSSIFWKNTPRKDWVAPWDIGKAQPSLIQAEKEGLLKGEVLDVGCGPGDNAIYLAAKGYQVTALDLSQHALERAAKRSKAAGIADGTLVFKQADMLHLGSTLGSHLWETALDSALLHCFPPELQPRYLAELQPHIKPGGHLILFCMSDANKDPYTGPERISKTQLQDLFSESKGWRMEQLTTAKYDTPVREGGFDTWRAYIKRV
ncbi:g8559 [Coccomyxa viridis]|uniref:G8559 protein n=1 Tax=Coccomyxa viridis TaxID=1274662 RepID=A0ABP1G0S1_9CHLO